MYMRCAAIYLMCIMGISATSVCLSVVVLNVRDGGERKAKVPLWLEFLAYRVLQPMICWSSSECHEWNVRSSVACLL